MVVVVRLGLHLQRAGSGLHVSRPCHQGYSSCDNRLPSVSRTSGRNYMARGSLGDLREARLSMCVDGWILIPGSAKAASRHPPSRAGHEHTVTAYIARLNRGTTKPHQHQRLL